MSRTIPYVPQYITVHLGPPNSAAQNATVAFPDYIKNVASSEIYPTWDDDALTANILAIISFALNRVYTEFYRAQGKDFDITSSTAIDQKFILGRNIFESIERIVDLIFNDYIRRIGNIEPLAAKFCDGTTVTCDGLSQWGSENLAQQGYSYLDILYRYYGYNIELVVDAPIRANRESYPGYPVRRGDRGAYVQIVQTMLNRISTAYPLIPKVTYDGIFGEATENAVKTFQRIFNLTPDGIVGKATWYRMVGLYTGILRLSELNSQGQRLFGYDLQYPNAVVQSVGNESVFILQYFLAMLAEYDPTQPPVAVDGIFGRQTGEAISAFQAKNGLPVTGTADEVTWDAIYDAYEGIVRAETQTDTTAVTAPPYPGRDLASGSSGEDVEELQRMLNLIGVTFKNLNPPQVTGEYDAGTQAAVAAFQNAYDLPETGITDEATWNAIARAYEDAIAVTFTHPVQFPGVIMRRGDRDADSARPERNQEGVQ